ncbi:hypothetical protein E0485_10040 [Paenibacillus albiflavus]|uniref:YxiS n=1 Tax=Paenibacillus albiflavus TaxID=2545760 RepID=A0A4R4ECW9_9BACL|nr:hypothetical protein [Paenibacillus albiflavus]TCZ77806.1 hypothetical protein E0485_10040 [Paenibacillus albiflavus]
MNQKEYEEQIIENYQRDERMMILVFAQWCVNHDLSPEVVYRKAYPDQADISALTDMLELTVPKEEAGEIANETLMGVLSLFGNDDLAFVVSQEIAGLKQK